MRAGIALVVGGLALVAASVVAGTLVGIAIDEQGGTAASIPFMLGVALGALRLVVGVARLGRSRAERG